MVVTPGKATPGLRSTVATPGLQSSTPEERGRDWRDQKRAEASLISEGQHAKEDDDAAVLELQAASGKANTPDLIIPSVIPRPADSVVHNDED
jgi:hypothetical protein